MTTKDTEKLTAELLAAADVRRTTELREAVRALIEELPMCEAPTGPTVHCNAPASIMRRPRYEGRYFLCEEHRDVFSGAVVGEWTPALRRVLALLGET